MSNANSILSGEFCDRCGPSALAYIFAYQETGAILTYCGHCGTRFRPGLMRDKFFIEDHTDLIPA